MLLLLFRKRHKKARHRKRQNHCQEGPFLLDALAHVTLFYVDSILLIIDLSIKTGDGADYSPAHTKSMVDAEGTFKA